MTVGVGGLPKTATLCGSGLAGVGKVGGKVPPARIGELDRVAVEEKRSASRQHKSVLNGGRSCWRSMPAPSRDDSIRGTVRERFLNVR